MSHYTKGSGLDINDPACLVAALAEMGLEAECHAEAEHLIGYHGDRRPEVAHVIIRRSQIGSSSNDIGFVFGPDGCAPIISDYDSHRFDNAWVRKVTQETRVQVAIKRARLRGERVARTTDAKTGRITLSITGRF